MIVGIIRKSDSKCVYTFPARTLRLSPEYSNELEYVAYEIVDGTHQDAYSWNGSEVVFDENWAAPKAVPPSITPRQLRLALLGAGKTLTDVENVIGALPEPDKTYASVSWEYATVFERQDPLVDVLGLMLGLTVDDIDDIFIAGASI